MIQVTIILFFSNTLFGKRRLVITLQKYNINDFSLSHEHTINQKPIYIYDDVHAAQKLLRALGETAAFARYNSPSHYRAKKKKKKSYTLSRRYYTYTACSALDICRQTRAAIYARDCNIHISYIIQYISKSIIFSNFRENYAKNYILRCTDVSFIFSKRQIDITNLYTSHSQKEVSSKVSPRGVSQ